MNSIQIQINNIFLSRGTNKILSNVSFNIHEKEIIALLGANGAGKTSLLRVISGIWKQDSGKVFLNGRELHEYSRKEIASNIAYLSQTLNSEVDFTVDEFLRFPSDRLLFCWRCCVLLRIC